MGQVSPKDLEKFDAAFRPAPPSASAPVELKPSSRIPNGFYTLVLPGGEHRTFRIRTKRLTAKFAPGQRLLGMLTGPDNEADYQEFAFVTDEGFRTWNRYRGSDMMVLADVLWRLAIGESVAGYSLEVSKRCLVCNRRLTTPESIARQIGASCYARVSGVKT